jgi:hypothetical protein
VRNCFRSQWGANLYADIRSTIETARRRAIGALEAIRLTLNGYPSRPRAYPGEQLPQSRLRVWLF